MLDRAVQNMLIGCGGLQAGARVLIVHEPEGCGYYDDALPPAIAHSALAQGFQVTSMTAPVSVKPSGLGALESAMADHDLTVFLARIGDQARFRTLGPATRAIVCYAIDLDTFATPFGTIDHAAMLALRDALDAAFAAATKIRVTCPAGTDYRGRISAKLPPKDTNTLRFPQLVYSPIPATGFSGRIAQRGFLVGTGSHYYTPYARELSATLMVEVQGNRITGFSGPDAAAARAHYADIALRCGADGDFVHSWHGGIHPASAYRHLSSECFRRWSGAAFGNPRLMHFHTCGAYAPGEISLNLLDPTITLDGVPVWENGRLWPDRVPGGAEVLAECPDLAAAFETPEQACGAGPMGRLTFA